MKVWLHVHVLSDALLVKGAPTGVTWVSNIGDLSTSCISYMYASPIAVLCTKWHISILFIDIRMRSYLKNSNIFSNGPLSQILIFYDTLLFHFFNHSKWTSKSKVIQISTKHTFWNPNLGLFNWWIFHLMQLWNLGPFESDNSIHGSMMSPPSNAACFMEFWSIKRKWKQLS